MNENEFVTMKVADGEKPPAPVLQAIEDLANALAEHELASSEVSGFSVGKPAGLRIGAGMPGSLDPGKDSFCLGFSESLPDDDGGKSSSCWIDWRQ